MERIRYPFRQNKIGEVSQGSNKTAKMNSGRDFIPAMRGEFAKITNAVLKARGISRHYDPRSYEAMGIDRTPTEHLGTKAAALEAIGVPTVVGQLNAIAIWNDAERAIERHAKHSDKELKERQKDIEALARKLSYHDTNHPTLITLRQLIAQRSQMIESLAEDRRAIMTFDHLEAKAKSRAIRTRQTCLQYLADIENGKADGSTRIMKSVIAARWKDAQTHIENIDEQLRPHRDELSQMAAEIERREKVVETLDKAYSDLEAEVLSYIDERNRIAQDYRYDLIHNREAPPTINAQSPAPVPSPATGQSIALGENAKTGSEPEPKSEPIAVEPTTASDAKTDTLSSDPAPPEQMTNNAPQQASNRQSGPTNRIEVGTETQPGPKPRAVERSEEKPAVAAGQLRPSTMDALPIETSVGPAPLQATTQSPAPVTTELFPALEDAQNSGSKPELKSEPTASVSRTASKAKTGEPNSEVTHPVQRANKAPQGASNRQITPTEGIEWASETQPTPKPQSVETSEQAVPPITAPLRPITMDGLPIVKPTIAPLTGDQKIVDTNSVTDIPEGLNPLRPEQPKKPDTPEPIIVIPDISIEAQKIAEEQLRSPNVASKPSIDEKENVRPEQVGSTPPHNLAASLKTTPNTPPTVAGLDRKAASQPDLFSNLGEPHAPTSVEPTEQFSNANANAPTTHEQWEALIDKISAQRIPVFSENAGKPNERFEVRALNPEEKLLLSTPRFAKRTLGRLKGIFERQQLEIKRLASWIEEHANDNSLLRLEGRKAYIGEKAPKAIKTLMGNWGRHPLVIEAVRNQNQRRNEIDKIETNQDLKLVEENQNKQRLSHQKLLAEAAEKYPEPDQVYTWQVSEFTRLLRELAPREKLQTAADLINASIDAREDVNRHTVHLATAFAQYVEGTDLPQQQQLFSDRDGRE